MSVVEILQMQLVDLFRIGLLAAMIYTASNTRAQAGRLTPIVFGIVFVAVLIPVAMGSGGADLTTAIVVGLFSNAIITAIIVAVWRAVVRLRG
jgi:formate/nitrite transporter FocA (FNT family)